MIETFIAIGDQVGDVMCPCHVALESDAQEFSCWRYGEVCSIEVKWLL